MLFSANFLCALRSFKLVSPSRLFVSTLQSVLPAPDVKHSNKSAGKVSPLFTKHKSPTLTLFQGTTRKTLSSLLKISASLELAMASATCLFLSSRAVNTPSTLNRNIRVRKVEGGSKVYGKPVPNKLKSAKHCANDTTKK